MMDIRETHHRQTDGGMAAKPDQFCLGGGKMAGVYLDSLIRISPDAIVATDKNGKIILFNQGAERLIGYKAEEMIGKPAAEFYSKEEVAR